MNERLEKECQVSDTAPIAEVLRKECRYCAEQISNNAIVCKFCRSYQNFFRHNLHHAGILISIIMVSIALFQLREARTKRIEADEALKKAYEAVTKTDHIYETVRKQALTFISTVWLQTKLKNHFGGPEVKAANDEIGNNLNDLLVLVIPDQDSRMKWINGLYEKMPKEKKPSNS